MHVALAVCSLTWITILTLNLNLDVALLSFVFFASITGYNFVKYFGIAKFHHKQLTVGLQLIQIVSFICFILMVYFATKLALRTLIYIGCLGLLTILYAIPFMPKRKNSALRNVSGIKVYVIALVWTGVTVFIPLINVDYNLSMDVVLLGIQQFIYVIVLMLPFEIRDLKFDSQKLVTIPQKFGVKKTKALGVLLLVLLFLMEFFKDEIHTRRIITLLLILITTALLVSFAKTEQNKYYCSFFVEGLPILWLILLLIIKFL